MSIAFIFPGTSTQYVGMGMDLYRQHAVARELYEQANDAVGFDLARISFKGPVDELEVISHAQPAVVTHSVALLELMRRSGVRPQVVGGHSLGEFPALVAAGVLGFQDAVRLVCRRAELIRRLAPVAGGTMLAIVGATEDRVAGWCELSAAGGHIQIANHNGSRQIVVSGELGAVALMERLVNASGNCRSVRLPMRYPFHSRLLKPVEPAFAELLSQVRFGDARLPVVSNQAGAIVIRGAVWRRLLLQQLCGPVYWDRAVQTMLGCGVSCFVELGPGRILQSLVRGIHRRAEVLGAQCCDSLQHTIDRLRSREKQTAHSATFLEASCAT
jgi:[acyl-carrier-protein] S-malonyltransferase